MANKLEMRIDELRVALRQLPASLQSEGTAIVIAHAEEAKRQIEANYAHSIRSGNLIRGLTIAYESAAWGTRAVIRNRARHAYWYEHGTEMRRTSKGVERGKMPPGHAFIPPAQRQRRLMVSALMDLVRRAGFFVSNAQAA